METDKKIAAFLPPVPPSAPPPAPAASDRRNNALPQVQSMHGRTTGPARRSTRGQWTSQEDEILCKAVHHYKGKNWKKIAEFFPDRTDVQCLHRWQKVLNPELVKGPWSKEEDEIIVQLVNKYGPKKWSTIAQYLPGRIGKQCRERWHNHLNPSINKEAWTQEEELVLIRAHQIHGNRWAELTKYLPGRTDNSIKNHWNSSVKKKLDSYIASRLLAEFQGLPVVSHQNESITGASSHFNHINRDDHICKDTPKIEESSEGSQVGCSQTASDMSNSACPPNQQKEPIHPILDDEDENAQPVDLTKEQWASRDLTQSYFTNLGWLMGLGENVLAQVIEKNNWHSFITIDDPVYPELIREFYEHLEATKRYVIISEVRGVRIVWNAKDLGTILGVPSEGEAPYLTHQTIDEETKAELLKALNELIGNPKGISTALPHQHLTPKWKVLAEFVRKFLLPKKEGRGNGSTKDAVLIYQLAGKQKINLPLLISKHMAYIAPIDVVHNLPYGSLLTRIFQHFKVPLEDEEASEKYLTAFNATTLKKLSLEVVDGEWEWVGEEKEKVEQLVLREKGEGSSASVRDALHNEHIHLFNELLGLMRDLTEEVKQLRKEIQTLKAHFEGS